METKLRKIIIGIPVPLLNRMDNQRRLAAGLFGGRRTTRAEYIARAVEHYAAYIKGHDCGKAGR